MKSHLTLDVPVRAARLDSIAELPFPATDATFAAPGALLLRRLLLLFAAIFPLICWPAMDRPFSQPKILLLSIVVPAGLLFSLRGVRAAFSSLPSALRWSLLAWFFSTSASVAFANYISRESLVLPLLGAGWLFLLLAVRPLPRDLAWSLVAGAGAVALLALLQFARFDPFVWLGWQPLLPSSARMRVYATLGNPDFVAAFLAALLPVSVSLYRHARQRWLVAILIALQAGALCSTGSRALLLALLGVTFCLAAFRQTRAALTLGVLLIAAAGIVSALHVGRPLSSTIQGRIYIWRVSAPHILDHRILGSGPGAFAAAYPGWESAYGSSGRANLRESVFAGLQQHAHDDFIEISLDYGLLGLAAWLAVLIAILSLARRLARDSVVGQSEPPNLSLPLGAAAGMVAMLSISLVDFPFERPTEQFAFWSLAALILLTGLSHHPRLLPLSPSKILIPQGGPASDSHE